jgi:hypothetical protein
MAEMIARLRADIENRLREIEGELAALEPLAAEKAKLEHVLATPPFAVDASVKRPRTKSTPKRAPRGANKAAVYDAVRDMPGASPGEIAAAAKVGKPQVFNLLRTGVEKAELTTVDLGGGRKGYRINEQPETAFPAPAPVEPPVPAPEAAASETKTPETPAPTPVEPEAQA